MFKMKIIHESYLELVIRNGKDVNMSIYPIHVTPRGTT